MGTCIGKKEIDQLKEGTWESLSAHMVVKKRGDKDDITGPGIIQQVKQNYFRIIIFTNCNTYEPMKDHLTRLLGDSIKLGEIIPESEYYDLVTPDGWNSERLSEPEIDYSANTGPIYIFYTREIFTKNIRKNKKTEAGVSYVAFSEYKGYPSNKPLLHGQYFKDEGHPGMHLCAADTKIIDYDFLFFVHEGDSTLRLRNNSDKKKHDDQIEFRAIEALEFVLSHPFEWNIKRVWDSEYSKVHIRLIPNRTSCYPKRPYDGTTPTEFKMYWDLYGKFLEYILKNKEKGYCGIGNTLRNLIKLRSSEHILRAYILALSIAIEDLTVRNFAQKVQDAKREKLILRLGDVSSEFLEKEKVPVDIAKMITEHIKRLKPSKETANRALLRLAEEKKLIKRRVKSWKKLRNTVAHGNSMRFNQKTLNQVGDLEVLFYQLIFQLIGYDGKYTDYGKLGYPPKEYPKKC